MGCLQLQRSDLCGEVTVEEKWPFYNLVATAFYFEIGTGATCDGFRTHHHTADTPNFEDVAFWESTAASREFLTQKTYSIYQTRWLTCL